VLVGDPGRHYSPAGGAVERGRHDVPVPREIEDRPLLTARVLEILPPPGP